MFHRLSVYSIPTTATKLRRTIFGAAVFACLPHVVLADPTPAPSLPIPSGLLNSPLVQGALNALGGITQTTNGPSAFGKVTFFKQFDLQIQTAPTVYRKIRLHQGTVINPRGASIAPGMTVQVSGSPQPDGSLNAETITLK